METVVDLEVVALKLLRRVRPLKLRILTLEEASEELGEDLEVLRLLKPTQLLEHKALTPEGGMEESGEVSVEEALKPHKQMQPQEPRVSTLE